jgi:hypothetical protein
MNADRETERFHDNMKTGIIGIDCATEPKKRGIAIAKYVDGKCNLTRVAIDKPEKDIALANADALDAIVCVLSGLDFRGGEAYHPKDFGLLETAVKEGWIWVKSIA